MPGLTPAKNPQSSAIGEWKITRLGSMIRGTRRAPGSSTDMKRPNILRRLLCFNLFWHALDIIWVMLFTIVYLIGEGR